MQDELTNVKVGDELIYGGYSGGRRVITVDRITPTQICSGNLKFGKRNGKMIGSSGWNTVFAHLPRQGEIEEILQKQKINNMQYKLEKLRITPKNMTHFEALFESLEELK